jgi:hypothetical protein
MASTPPAESQPGVGGRGTEVSTKPWRRLSVNVALDVAQAIEILMRRHHVSTTEVIRRAISAYKFLDDEIAAGHKIIIERDGSLCEVKFL